MAATAQVINMGTNQHDVIGNGSTGSASAPTEQLASTNAAPDMQQLTGALASKFSAPHQQYVSRHLQMEQQLIDADRDPSWQVHSTQQDVRILTKQPNPDVAVTWSLGRGELPFAPSVIDACMKDTEHKSEHDEFYDTSRVIAGEYHAEAIAELVHLAAKTPSSFVTARDTVFHSMTRYITADNATAALPEGTIISTTFSVEHEAAPINPKYVRALLIYGGCLLIPVNGGTSTQCSYITAVDPVGNIPKFLVNTATTKQPLTLATLRTQLSKPKFRLYAEKYAKAWDDKRHGRSAMQQQQNGSAPSTNEAYNVGVPPEYVAALDQAEQLGLEATFNHDDTSWTSHSADDSIEIQTKTVDTNNYSRGYTTVNDYTPLQLLSVFVSHTYRTKYDELMNSTTLVQQYNPYCSVGYIRFTDAPFPIYTRDICVVGRIRKISKGNDNTLQPLNSPAPADRYADGEGYMLTTTSIDHPQCPTKKSLVRARAVFNTFYVRQFNDSSNPPRCVIIYSMATNPNGSLPKALTHLLATKTPTVIAKMLRWMRSHPQQVQEIVEQYAADERKLTEAAATQNGQSSVESNIDDALNKIENQLLHQLQQQSSIRKSLSHAWRSTYALPEDVTDFQQMSPLTRLQRAHASYKLQRPVQIACMYLRIVSISIPRELLLQVANDAVQQLLVRITVESTNTTFTPIAELQLPIARQKQRITELTPEQKAIVLQQRQLRKLLKLQQQSQQTNGTALPLNGLPSPARTPRLSATIPATNGVSTNDVPPAANGTAPSPNGVLSQDNASGIKLTDYELTAQQRLASHLIAPIRDLQSTVHIQFYLPHTSAQPLCTLRRPLHSLIPNQHTHGQLQVLTDSQTNCQLTVHTYYTQSSLAMLIGNLLSPSTLMPQRAALIQPIATQFITDIEAFVYMWCITLYKRPHFILLIALPILLSIQYPSIATLGLLMIPLVLVASSYNRGIGMLPSRFEQKE